MSKTTTKLPQGVTRLRRHRLSDGSVYAISFALDVPGVGQVEVYSQPCIRWLNRRAETTATIVTPAGAVRDSCKELGSLNPHTAVSIVRKHLLPSLRRRAGGDPPQS